MNLIELSRSLHQLSLGGKVAVLETRLLQAQTENMAPIDLLSTLVSTRSSAVANGRWKDVTSRRASGIQTSDWRTSTSSSIPKMNRNLIFDLATAGWAERREDALFQGPPGSGKSHLAPPVGYAVIQQGYRVLYCETHILLEEWPTPRSMAIAKNMVNTSPPFRC
jgi:hypothetical protein